jgi:hypothetical protein
LPVSIGMPAGADDFDALDSASEEDAKDVLPALRVVMGHIGKAVEQDFKNFCVKFIGVFGA